MSAEETTPLPSEALTQFDQAQIEVAMKMNALSTLHGLGLAPRQRTPSFEAALGFRRQKARFFADDIEHADVFKIDDDEHVQ